MSRFGSSTIAQTTSDYNVPQAGNDGISSLSWSPTSNILTSTNWDGGIRCWEVQEQNSQIQAMPKAQANHENNAPVLCSTFSSDGGTIFTGGVDKAVRMWNLNQQLTTPNAVPQQIGVHTEPIKSIGFLKSNNMIVSGGYDKKLNFWDARSPNPVGSIDLPERCYDIDVKDNLMVVATADRHVLVYDVSGATPREHMRKQSPLKYQTRCVSCFPDMSGFAIGSIEGRVGIQYNTKAQESKNFSFKCHRDGTDVYAVNAIAFHPAGVFATVGSDGITTFWDKDNKQKLKGFPKVGKPISCAAFNTQGNLFAYAKSYDWSQGSSYYAPGSANEINIHLTLPEEIKQRRR